MSTTASVSTKVPVDVKFDTFWKTLVDSTDYELPLELKDSLLKAMKSAGIYEPEAKTEAKGVFPDPVDFWANFGRIPEGAQPTTFGTAAQAFAFAFGTPAPAPVPVPVPVPAPAPAPALFPLIDFHTQWMNNQPVTQADAKQLFVRRKTDSNEEFLRAYEDADLAFAEAKTTYAQAKADYSQAIADAKENFLSEMEEIEKDYAEFTE